MLPTVSAERQKITRMVVPQLLLMTLAGALTLSQKQRIKNRSPPQNEHVIKIRNF